MRKQLLGLLLAIVPQTASAQEREFCADRPGLGTPACTVEPGRIMAEMGIVGWDHSSDPAQVGDDLTYGNLLIRTGLDDRTEIELGFDGYGTTRLRDRTSGLVSRQHGAGDMTIALRRGLSGPNGPIAVHGFVSLPAGGGGIGAGDWGAGLLVPIGIGLPRGFEIDLTPELDAAVNGSGKGRHLAWGGVVGLSHAVGPMLSIEAELAAWRHDDPAGHYTDARSAVSVAWQAGKNWQIDLELDLGLSAAAPDRSLMFGMARRF
ncbi:MAG: transporter [Proteobacteria bacterium]|nr:transporter [Pseudomonadota bacterium]